MADFRSSNIRARPSVATRSLYRSKALTSSLIYLHIKTDRLGEWGCTCVHGTRRVRKQMYQFCRNRLISTDSAAWLGRCVAKTLDQDVEDGELLSD